MKALKLVFIVIIAYFGVTAFSAMNRLVDWLSRGNVMVAYALYGLFLILAIIYVLIPILDYMNRPSLLEVEKLMDGDVRAGRRVRRHLLNKLEGESLVQLKAIDKKDIEGIKSFVQSYLIAVTDGFDKVIRTYAFKLTSTVLLSPNSFIDGLAILYGNSNMIYEMSKQTGFRYSTKDLFNMYFSVLSIASVSGLIEEFDDELEEIIAGVVEEFSNAISEETGRSLGDSIPFLNVAVRASTVLFQAAGNYAFVMYNGKRYKYRVRNAVDFSKKTEEEIRKLSRKEARRSRYLYVHEMIKRIGLNGASSIKDLMRQKNNENMAQEEGFFDEFDLEGKAEKSNKFFDFFQRGKGGT